MVISSTLYATRFWAWVSIAIVGAAPLSGFTIAESWAAKGAGCGISHNLIGSTVQASINSSGGLRTYRIHLPSSYDPDTRSALILSYHGAGETAEIHEDQTQLSNETYNPNMIAVYPQGLHVSNGNTLLNCFHSVDVGSLQSEWLIEG